MQLLKNSEIVQVEAPAVAGTSDLLSDYVDMANYDGVMFIVSFGTITSGAVTSIKARQNTANSDSGAADLEGSSVTVPDTGSDKVAVLDIYKPRERYVACAIDRGTQNAVVNGITAIKYGPRKGPVTQGATVSASEAHASPAEGTA